MALRVYFISDTSGVFDEMVFPSADAARESLDRNGFWRFTENSDLQSFLRPPSAPFRRAIHPRASRGHEAPSLSGTGAPLHPKSASGYPKSDRRRSSVDRSACRVTRQTN